MISWKHPEWFFALGLLLLVGALYVLYRRKQIAHWRALGEPSLLRKMGVSLRARVAFRQVILLGLAFTFLILALANPRVGRRYERVKQRGVDVIIALDISLSMLASDEHPTRLARAKLLIDQFVSQANGDRVGLILFAGDAFVLVPLTGDYPALSSILTPVEPALIPRQGTAIGQAIQLGIDAFGEPSGTFRTMFVITDGEDHEGGAMEIAASARDNGLRVHTIGVGSVEGSTIMESVAGRETGTKRDRSGQEVISRMNPEMLANVAGRGGGEYRKLGEIRTALEEMNHLLDQMTEQDFDERFITDYEEQFSWPLVLALILLLVESFLTFRRPKGI